mmetsp:Transcript_18209/g.50704  ORF Transcript_18209/g.50704 Transcript_18209/m.50704 type:complete len:507 (+) Transcript_18209:73-1593(+)
MIAGAAPWQQFVGQRLEGTVTSFKLQWGWVASPQIDGDIFCHTDDLIHGSLAKGALVIFEVGVDPKSGRARARQIEASLPTAPSANAFDFLPSVPQFAQAQHVACGIASGPRIEGSVKSWKEPWGWFSCDSGAQDVFAHREDIIGNDPLIPLEPGNSVTFELGAHGKSGKRRALSIEPVVTEQRWRGTITTWRDMWGWISCPDVLDGDLFAHRDDMPLTSNVAVGVTVSFELGFDEQGRRRARRIGLAQGAAVVIGVARPGASLGTGTVRHACLGNVLRSSSGPMTSAMVEKLGKAHFSLGVVGGCAVAAPAGNVDRHDVRSSGVPLGQQLNGLVSMWKDQWGWISNPLLVADIFAHVEDLNSEVLPIVGSPLSFVVGQDSKGRSRALNIQLLTPPADGLPNPCAGKRMQGLAFDKGFQVAEGLQLQGLVASWKLSWGWIRCGDGVFSGDIFAHSGDVEGGGDLTVGEVVCFVVGRDLQSGRWRARNIIKSGMAPDGSPAAKRHCP